QLFLAWFDGQPVTLNRGGTSGTLTTPNLYVGNITFNLFAADSATNHDQRDRSTVATGATSNAIASVQLMSDSTLNLGANMNLTGNFDIRDTGTIVNLNGHPLNVGNQLFLAYFDGQPITLNRGGAGGTLTTPNLYVGNITFDLLATDSVTNYAL